MQLIACHVCSIHVLGISRWHSIASFTLARFAYGMAWHMAQSPSKMETGRCRVYLIPQSACLCCRFIFTNTHGLHFGSYGPADQGAFNQFYESDVSLCNDSTNMFCKRCSGPLLALWLSWWDVGRCEV